MTTEDRPRKSYGVRAGSWNEMLSMMEVGERHYIETTVEGYPQLMRTINTPASRRPAEMRDSKFSTNLFTAVMATRVGEIRYLLCIERKA
ncbi:hypothetical protein [Burkholderia pseudomallei]|uniref:hypothetical protein n=2 Tax=Burkholderiaceae TaxID=119060 RepID=UPI0011AF36EF|nr:hypothetical protein [Burkholderia pseudomallei]MBF3563893.1 hypothetical protein [Burkholderia pseudomallei]MBF3800090.1 hypothetical protein [Burkholderia pseudomallei]MBF3843943.1 hypothetical protein [Burkholderia pseudomallei]